MKPSLLKARTSYVILCPSDLVFHSIRQKLIALNLADGVYSVPCLLGEYLEFSDTATPNDFRYVVSRVPRQEPEFKVLDVSENWLDIFRDVEECHSHDLGKFFNSQDRLRYQPLDYRYRVYLLVLHEAVGVGGELNWSLAHKIVENQFSLVWSYSDKVQSVVRLINSPNSSNLSEFMKVFKKEEFPLFVSILNQIITDDLPDYIKARVREVASGKQFQYNLSKIVVGLIHIRGYEDFVLSLYRVVEDTNAG